VRRDCKINR